MAFNLSESIGNTNDAMFPSPNKNNANLPSAFGGESNNFAKGVTEGAAQNFYTQSTEPSADTVAKGMGTTKLPKAIANKYALFNFQGFHGNLSTSQTQYYKDQPNNPLMGGGVGANTASVSSIVEFFEGQYPKISYRPADFLYSKYYKKIPVNHLITLRRFPTPIPDNIYNYNVRPQDSESGAVDITQVAGVTAITYLGETAGNKLDDLLKFSFGLNWKDIEGKMESVDTGESGGGYTQQPFYSKLGGMGTAVVDTAKGQTAGGKFRKQNGAGSSTADRLGTTYANFVLGPINVVKDTTIRDTGIKFANDMTLAFEYELKSLSYVNPKIAMLDIISNMLTMTTNNAQFFGGGHRYYGSAGYVASAFGNPNLLRDGNFSGYMGSLVTSVEKGMKNLYGGDGGGFDKNNIIESGLKIGKQLLGNMLGSFLGAEVGGQTGTAATAALISGEPTGDWHITVGNPLNPIVMMGNMICKNTSMTLGAGLGYDDFPMEVKFEIDMSHGKPRDKGDIESMFNAGQGRTYASAANAQDILNLAAVDYATYGSVPIEGTKTTQSTNGAPMGSLDPKTYTGKNVEKGAGNSVAAEYVSNVVSMMTDS
jgi:hypothetical protein|tara:strand:+ start:2589 stop:4376 length:1788 start_codon:yes stop_codon:yes gene_type:complete